MPDTSVRFAWISGDTIPISATGVVTCSSSADATIRASLGELATNAALHCRPVEKVRMRAPIQFVIPDDTSETVRVEATDAEGNYVSLLSASITIVDTTVATIDGDRVIPRAPGSTVAGVRVGNRDAGAGVHVYERVNTLSGLRPNQKLAAVVLNLSPGESREWEIGRGGWMITMLPEDDESGIRLRIDGADCRPGFTPRRYTCYTKTSARIAVYNPAAAGNGPPLTGRILVRRLDD